MSGKHSPEPAMRAHPPAHDHKAAATSAARRKDRGSCDAGVLAAHNALGNAGMLRLLRSGLLRTKRQVSMPGDRWEEEADRVADMIVSRTPAAMVQRACTCGTGLPCEECEEEPVLRKSAVASPPVVGDTVTRVSGTSGEPLTAATREFFEGPFGRDLSDVRIHRGAEAASSARSIAAEAYTVGSHIVFDEGKYAPETAAGQKLLAHELTHVVQQRGTPASSPLTISRQPAATEPFRLDAPDPAAQNVSWAEPPEAVPENVSWSDEPVSTPDVPEPVCRPASDLVCEREGEPEPLGPTIKFQHVLFAANADYLDWLLRREVRLFGLDETARLVELFLLSQGAPTGFVPAIPADAGERGSSMVRWLRSQQERLWPEIALAVYDSFVRVKREVNAYITSYKRTAEENLLTLLARSEARVDAERIRYGLQSKEDILHYWSPLRLDAEMRKNPSPEDAVPALKELATAAGILARLKRQLAVTRTQRDVIRFQDLNRLGTTSDIPAWQSAYRSFSEQSAQVADEARLYEFQKAELTERYPVLAAYESDIEKLDLLASGTAVKVIEELHDKMYAILTNIASVRKDVNDHDVNIWKLPRLISATNMALGIREGSFEDALIKQKIEQENDESFWRSIGLAVVQVGLVLLAPATGGLSLIGAAAISGAMLYKSVDEYVQQKAMAGTDFDRALAIASEEPSLFWVAMDAVLFIPDALGALKAFRTVRALLSEYRAAKSADEAAEVLGRLERAAAADGGEAFAQRMVAGAQAGRQSGLRSLFRAADVEALEAAGEAAARAVSGPVLVERITVAGTLKITPGGHMVICDSPCRWLREVFATALAQNADLEARLARIEQEVQWALARADQASVSALGIQTQTLMRDLVKETVGDLPLNRAQWRVLNDIEAALEGRGLDWTDLGFRDRSELVEVLNTPGRADDVLARLRQRAETAQEVAASAVVRTPLTDESRLNQNVSMLRKAFETIRVELVERVGERGMLLFERQINALEAFVERAARSGGITPEFRRRMAEAAGRMHDQMFEALALPRRLQPADVARLGDEGLETALARWSPDDPLIGQLLAQRGTWMHEEAYRFLRSAGNFPENTLFTENTIRELARVVGRRLPFRPSAGPDLYILNHQTHTIYVADMTRVAGRAGHVSKSAEDIRRLQSALQGSPWTVAPQVLEPEWVGTTTGREFGQAVADLLRPFAAGP